MVVKQVPIFAAFFILGQLVSARSAEPVVSRAVVRDITDRAGQKDVIDRFQENLRHLGIDGKISNCSHYLSYFIRDRVGRDSSFAAICRVTYGKIGYTLIMCDDIMIGKFSLSFNSSFNRQFIEQFVGNNCPPGG